MHQPHGRGRDARRLLGGLGDHRIAGHQRGDDLPGEDREREIPRADADEHAASAVMQFVGLAGRPRHPLGHERNARLCGVVAAEVGGLAHLGECIVQCFSAFDLHQRDERIAVLLVKIGDALERGGAIRNRRLAPGRNPAAAPLSAPATVSPFASASGAAFLTPASSASRLARSPNSTPIEFLRAP